MLGTASANALTDELNSMGSSEIDAAAAAGFFIAVFGLIFEAGPFLSPFFFLLP